MEKRQRLLEAAGEVFAQRGFKAATIQEISQRANANIASVNYHFRDKEGLYREVFRYAVEQSRSTYLPPSTSERRPAQLLKLELSRNLRNIFSPDRLPWVGMIFFREMLEPTDVFDSVVSEVMAPYQRLIESIVREVIGPNCDERVVRFSAFTAISLCGTFHSAEKYLAKLYPEEQFGADDLDSLAELITTFVLGGMRALKNPPKRME